MKKLLFILLLLPLISFGQADSNRAHRLTNYNLWNRPFLTNVSPEALYIDSLLHNGGIPVVGGGSTTTGMLDSIFIRQFYVTEKGYQAASKAGYYPSGFNVGTVQTVPIQRIPQGKSIINNLEVFDLNGQSTPLTIFVFNSAPAGTYADSVNFALSVTDITKLIRVINVDSTDYHTFGSTSYADGVIMEEAITGEVSQNLYFLAVTRANRTFIANEFYYKWGAINN